jgi:hypothetical protein
MRKSFIPLVCCAALSVAALEKARATGGFTPSRWLENGGVASEMSPEFYWELELKRIAQEFRPPEKRVAAGTDTDRAQAVQDDAKPAISPETKLTSQADTMDFDDAIKSGKIKPPDVAKAKTAHETARALVSTAKETATDSLPEEFDSEFADYHRGALAFRKGEAHFAEARAAWEALLKRPKDERHYRTVWATFMLGKLALAAKDPEAVKWFRQTRELAKDGFADSLGLAADSYGWEARSELRQGHDETAAKLYLTQLALGDDSAIVSLKAVIPDRPSVEGMKNYGEDPPENSTPEQIKQWNDAQEPKIQSRLDAAARSPLLRQLVTAHVLATETQEEIWSYGAEANSDGTKAGERCRRWLATLEKAGIRDVANADHLGWVAYTVGRYKEAADWLAIAKPGSGSALWLKAKLQRRDGKLAEATQTMASAFKIIGGEKAPLGERESYFTYGGGGYRPEQSAAGDLAGLHLSRGEFVNAMAAFLAGNLWDDAAFVGDRVLTTDELKKYVDEHCPEAAPKPKTDDFSPPDNNARMRWMLARRLVREDRYVEARGYFPKELQPVLDRYVAALKDAENTKLAKPQRARALFNASWIARHDGMEIMGTEVEPDGFVSEGNFDPGHVDTQRTEGAIIVTEYDDAKKREVEIRKPVKLFIAATAEEKRRIEKNRPHPTNRFHYRWVASALAWKAAGLMPDGTGELADVLNSGGNWIKDRDEKGADKFIQAIERRCPKTEIGQATLKKHWFTDLTGPWSEALDKQHAAEDTNRR